MPNTNLRMNLKPLYNLGGTAENALAHRLYDLSIEDINERQQKSFVKNSATETADYLGVNLDKIARYRKPGKQLYSPKHKKLFAIRLAK